MKSNEVSKIEEEHKIMQNIKEEVKILSTLSDLEQFIIRKTSLKFL